MSAAAPSCDISSSTRGRRGTSRIPFLTYANGRCSPHFLLQGATSCSVTGGSHSNHWILLPPCTQTHGLNMCVSALLLTHVATTRFARVAVLCSSSRRPSTRLSLARRQQAGCSPLAPRPSPGRSSPRARFCKAYIRSSTARQGLRSRWRRGKHTRYYFRDASLAQTFL